MLVDIKSITHSLGATLTLDLDISPDDPLIQFEDYRLTRPLQFQGQLLNSGEGIISLAGRIQAAYRGECARCLTGVESSADLAVDECFRSASLAAGDTADDSYPYEGTMLDVGQAILDNIRLALPQRLLCREDCQGLCPVCGANRNEQDCGHAAEPLLQASGFDQLKGLLEQKD